VAAGQAPSRAPEIHLCLSASYTSTNGFEDVSVSTRIGARFGPFDEVEAHKEFEDHEDDYEDAGGRAGRRVTTILSRIERLSSLSDRDGPA